MTETKIKISQLLDNQFPEFVRTDYPLIIEFLKEYYRSQESPGGPIDILENLIDYNKIDNLSSLVGSTVTSSYIYSYETTINVESTYGFPDSYGLLKIDDEIITYKSKTDTAFLDCVRGFSGTTSYQDISSSDSLVFSTSVATDHLGLSTVQNLSILFLHEFFRKIKSQIAPGFENTDFADGLDQRLFLKQLKDFYSSKGTDSSFGILFAALYGEPVQVVKPKEFLIKASDAEYRIAKDLVVEAISGDPTELLNRTIFQDESEYFNKASGTVYKVEKIDRGDKEYYTISLDYDYNRDINVSGTVFGQFSVHPRTQIVEDVPAFSEVINVDSTVGFPSSGELYVILENGGTIPITYTSKTLNQFFGCSGVVELIPKGTSINYSVYAYGYNYDDEKITFRVTGVLSGVDIPKNTALFDKGNEITIKNLGIFSKNLNSNQWFLNVPLTYDVSLIRLVSSSTYTYDVSTYDEHTFRVGDTVVLTSQIGTTVNATVYAFLNQNSFTIKAVSLIPLQYSYSISKNLSKANFLNYPTLSKYTTNVQNIFVDLQDKDSFYVASPSLPSYLNRQLSLNNRAVSFYGSFDANKKLALVDYYRRPVRHSFYTGDAVVYTPSSTTQNLQKGLYFIYKIDEYNIKLAYSRENISTNNFISVSGDVNGTLEFAEFTYSDLSSQQLEPQKLIRKISKPFSDSNLYETNPGATGIFINGVELLNYKSRDYVYFGEIQEIIPTSPGDGYDIINPPILEITDESGTDAEAYCSVIGGLKSVNIVDPGFDYLEQPEVIITGGNGRNASAKARLVEFEHEAYFNANSYSGMVNLENSTIGFSSFHRFRDVEKVVYKTYGQQGVSGLSTNSYYFVRPQDQYNVKLYYSEDDAIAGVNTVVIDDFGIGNHSFKSFKNKLQIGSITVENPGTNYQNKKISVSYLTGINTASNSILCKNHGYNSGEIVVYTPTETPIAGLSSSTQYYVTTVNQNEFRLSIIGVGTAYVAGISTLNPDFYYRTKQYVNLETVGTGYHEFNYPPIQVSVKGRIGISSVYSEDFDATVVPIFRGQIQSVSIKNGGVNYGSQEIINYNRQPEFKLKSGKNAICSPIISNTSIVDVSLDSFGLEYNSIPDIVVLGDGKGAQLTPVISSEGYLTDVKVIYGGNGYSPHNTEIIIVSAGKDAGFEARIRPWRINNIERAISSKQISNDDGFIDKGLDNDFGLQYMHAYAPRNLRSSTYGKRYSSGTINYVPDLQFLNNNEIYQDTHSPILGWAYDGNPIYGPYGYSTPSGGAVKLLTSGYSTPIIQSQRPSAAIYSPGFFVEDYQYLGNGDLDERNGRFCVTPEYPNGTYAYFCTIDTNNSSDGFFIGYKKPVFPYVIGNYYKSRPISFNFDINSNQDFIDINETGWLRNTFSYNLLSDRTKYDYIFDPTTIKTQTATINKVTTGKVDSVGIITGGYNYKVNDQILFDNRRTFGNGASAYVSSIKGVGIATVSLATTSIDYIEFSPYGNSKTGFVGFATIPHNFIDKDFVTFTGFYDFKKTGQISLNVNKLALAVGVATTTTTGIVTYFNVYGNLDFPNIKENDIYQIGDEEVKILNVDTVSSRIRVLRAQNNTSGLSSHLAGIALTEKTRKLSFNFGLSTSSYRMILNDEYYFNPSESLGIGTLFGVGIGYTLSFSNPGIGVTRLRIPTKSIYLPNHNLETGTELIYSTNNSGNRIAVSTDGKSSFLLNNNSIVYATKLSNDLIGISTVLVGVGNTGDFVGIGTSVSDQGLLYLTNAGSGRYHSFKTNYDEILSGDIKRHTVTVETTEPHNLGPGDNININFTIGITTTVVVKYDDSSRRLLVNPRNFIGSDVDINRNTIRLKNHRFYEGQKVLHTSTSPCVGLAKNGTYYVIVVDTDRFKLAENYFNATKEHPPTEVNLLTASFGTISQINPPLNIVKNNVIKFDLSDSTLSYKKNNVSYPAFDLNLYKDSKFIQKFEGTGTSSNFEITKVGRVGIDSTAAVYVAVNDNFPRKFYYKLDPIDIQNNLSVKKEIITDDDIIPARNRITLVDSYYNGNHSIVGISSTTFSFNINNVAESYSYTPKDGSLVYSTSSLNAYGPIYTIKLLSKGNRYKIPPIVSKITSLDGSKTSGYGSILEVKTSSIGSINGIELTDIGFDYPSDLSLRPSANLPILVKTDALYALDSIGVTSEGKNYVLAPKLIIKDGLTDKLINSVDLRYKLKTKNVRIFRNYTGFYNTTPVIIPTSNTNGVPIQSIVYNPSNKDVTVTLGSSFSDAATYPFAVGDKVLIEGTSVGVNTTGKGYDSVDYNYALFTLTAVDANIGGSLSTVRYNLSSYLNTGEYPGNFNPTLSSGTIVPQKYFPVFDIKLKKGRFLTGETVTSSDATGKIDVSDPNNNYIKISIKNNDFVIGDFIQGRTSKTLSYIVDIISYDSSFGVSASSIVRKGWEKTTGFLSDNLQRVHDNNYYQNFSYALKSKVPYDIWNDSVSHLNHTAGFKRFGDLIVESKPIPKGDNDYNFVGIKTDQSEGDFSSLVDIIEVVDVNCVYDFDLVREVTLGYDKSDSLLFNSKTVQDYSGSIGNKVLILDNISQYFNSNPRPTIYVDVDNFNLAAYRYKKYIAFIQDRKDITSRQVSLVSLLHNNVYGFISQYAILTTSTTIGSFDFSISGNYGTLQFYPIFYAVNNYDVSAVSFGLSDFVTGVGNTTFGDLVRIGSATTTLNSGISTSVPIVGISSLYRSSKVLVSITAADSSYFESQEISVVRDNGTVHLLEYGKLTSENLTAKSSVGLGTYDARISGSNLYIDFKPNSALTSNYIINTEIISIGNTYTSTDGYLTFDNSEIRSRYIGIASTSAPVGNFIGSFGRANHQIAYIIASIEDKTNNTYQLSELIVGHNDTLAYVEEFGITPTTSGIGTFDAVVSSSSTVSVYFKPNPGINVDVRLFQMSVGVANNATSLNQLSFTNADILTRSALYVGNELDIKRDFELTYQGNSVFKRNFDGSSEDVINLSDNTFLIPNHYFTPGEKITYSFGDPLNSLPIGIASTSISGITTNILPSTLYVVKINESTVRVSASATDALSTVPKTLNITSVGVGTLHSFISSKQNTKTLITVDNVVQSPIVSTAVTTKLSSPIGLSNDLLVFSGITSFFGGDLIQIDDEIMRINSIGVGSTNNVFVQRQWMGTELKPHAVNSLIRKVQGDYNITNNTISFLSAPYGKVLLTSDLPDEQDYTGLSTNSTFSGRVFLRSGVPGSTKDAYYTNYVFDDISGDFDGKNKTFPITSSQQNITDVYDSNGLILINNVVQGPVETGVLVVTENYELTENAGITSITFTGTASSVTYDVNTSSIPRGGILVSLGSTSGLGYQPLVSAAGTARVSAAGTIQSISIGNSGSGYRSGIQTVRVGVQTESLTSGAIDYIGTATISKGNIVGVAITNPGVGYTVYQPIFTTNTTSTTSSGSTGIYINGTASISIGNYISVGTALTNVQIVGIGTTTLYIGAGNTIKTGISSGTTAIIKSYKPPVVVFDSPLSYSNIPLIYSSASSPGFGTGAKVDIVVGQGSSVISFEIKNAGFGYGNDEILTIAKGGTTGIPTDTSKPFSEFQIKVSRVFSDKFSGWTFGQLQVLDSFDDLIDGTRTSFPIRLNNRKFSIKAQKGYNLDLRGNLLIFVNDILQVPDESYSFTGGNRVVFGTPLKENSTTKVFFYRGTKDVDTIDVNILEPLQIGDTITVNSDAIKLQEDERLITDVLSTEEIKTNLYFGPGIANTSSLLRPVTLCRQTEDLIINGIPTPKNREFYEPLIYPNTNIIQNVGSASSIIFVESLRPHFDLYKENVSNQYISKIEVISQDTLRQASATAVVSTAGTVSSIRITDGGVGYSTNPAVTIANPVGLGTTQRASATTTVGSGTTIASVKVTIGGTGYSSSNLPQILIAPPKTTKEIISNCTYEGDHGVITQVRQVTVAGVASTGLYFDLFIPMNSPMRDVSLVGTAVTISGIQTGYYFVVRNSKIGNGSTSINSSGNVVGVATSCLDNVYQVLDSKIIRKNIVGVGTTSVKQILVGLTTYNGYDYRLRTFDSTEVTFDSTTDKISDFDSNIIYWGNYSWGKITADRDGSNSFNFYGLNGVGGITTSAIVKRYNPLAYVNYIP